jgi:hypothetical protein
MACACGCSGRKAACGSNSIRVQVSHVTPVPLVPVGELRGVIYRASRFPGDAVRTYVHFFDSRPLLASNRAGRRLFIVGGRYRVTPDGIIG